MTEKTQDMTDKEKESQRLWYIAEELVAYLGKLQKKAMDCNNEMQRVMRKVIETGELSFRINNEDVDIKKFFHILLIVMNFNIPRESLQASYSISRKRIPSLVEKIGNLLNFFICIPGVKVPPAPKSYKEQLKEAENEKNVLDQNHNG
jgi:hypothetical protein